MSNRSEKIVCTPILTRSNFCGFLESKFSTAMRTDGVLRLEKLGNPSWESPRCQPVA